MSHTKFQCWNLSTEWNLSSVRVSNKVLFDLNRSFIHFGLAVHLICYPLIIDQTDFLETVNGMPPELQNEFRMKVL